MMPRRPSRVRRVDVRVVSEYDPATVQPSGVLTRRSATSDRACDGASGQRASSGEQADDLASIESSPELPHCLHVRELELRLAACRVR